MVRKRARKLELLKEELIEPIFVGDENPEILIVGFGSTYESIKGGIETLNARGNGKYAFLSFGDVYPLPTKKLLKYSNRATRVVSIEQNYNGQLAGIIREETLIDCRPAFLKYDGRQMDSEEIIAALETLEKGVK